MGKRLITEGEFAKAYEELSDALFRHCYFRVYGRERAVELMQETFTKAWHYIAIEEHEIENLRAFLYRVANNLIIDEYRKKKSESLDVLMESGFEPADDGHIETMRSSEAKEALQMLHKLEEADRTVVMMRYIDDLSPKEIAEATGQTENNVSVRLHRAIKKLRKFYDER